MTGKRRIVGLCLVLLTLAITVMPVAAAEKKVEILLWHHWTGGERIGYVQKLLDDFNKLYPWIEAKQISQGTGGAASKLTSFIVGGAAPELVQVSSLYALPFITQGAFLELDELAARDRVELRAFNAVDLKSFQLDGSTFALPVTSGVAWTNLMIYNKSMMAEVGIDPNAPANTWTDWRNQARRMTRVGSDGTLLRAGSSIPAMMNAVNWNNGSLWSSDWKKATVDTTAMHQTIEFLANISNDIYGGYANYIPWINSHKFTMSDYGFWFQNNSAFAFLKDVDFEWGAKLAPVGPQPGSKPVGMVQSSWAYAIPITVSPEKREAAWLLLSWLTTKQESAGWFTRIQGRPSAITSFNRHSDYFRQNPSWNVVIDAVNYDIAIPPGVDIWNKLMPFNDQILNGRVSPSQGLQDAQRTLQEMLDDYWSVASKK